ncbi:MAG: hypothetical protein AUJ72_01535 [Candidatus Omnitrophica bacterium CG1_02_46_14]|nr:MAG: hypothetical protein AUJ72_01535 [Candidatus Omnitrophica bacterium CG1_02_46_14]
MLRVISATKDLITRFHYKFFASSALFCGFVLKLLSQVAPRQAICCRISSKGEKSEFEGLLLINLFNKNS